MGIMDHIFGLGLKKWLSETNPDAETVGRLLTGDARWITLKSGEEEEGGKAKGRRVLIGEKGKILGGNLPKEAQGMNVREWGEKAGEIVGEGGKSEGGGNEEPVLGETKVPTPSWVFDWLKTKPGNVYADYKALQKKHPDQFATTQEVKDHVEYVLSHPTMELEASKPEYSMLVRRNGEDRVAVVEFTLKGGKYRVRSAYIMDAGQLDTKVRKLGERGGRVSTAPANPTPENQPLTQGAGTPFDVPTLPQSEGNGSNNTEKVKAGEEREEPEPKEDQPISEQARSGYALSEMRDRLSIEEPEGGEFEKKYGQYFIRKDGERVAKLIRWKNRMTGEESYAIEALQRKKGKSSIVIPECSTKEDLLDKYAMKLFSEEQEKRAREAESKERAKRIREAKRAAAISGATTANRQEATRTAFDEDEEDLKPKAKEPYHFSPKRARVQVGSLDSEMADYTEVVPARIELVNKKTILTAPRPSWIPEISENDFDGMMGRLEGVKIGEDRYIIKTSGRARSMIELAANTNSRYSIVNLAALTATQDYYSKYRKAKYDQTTQAAVELGNGVVETMRKMHRGMAPIDAAKEATKSLGGRYADMNNEQIQRFAKIASTEYDRYLAATKRFKESGRNYEYPLESRIESYLKDIDRNAKRSKPKMVGTNRATYSHLDLIGQALPEARGQTAKWKAVHEFVDDMRQMSIDMNLQMEESASTYSRGQETSYGRSGAVKDLLDSHGVVVNRQNGDTITPIEVSEIKNAIDSVYSVFGNQSGVAKRTKLLISHSGEKLMHARRASGIYSPMRNAIGVTWQSGQRDAGFTLAHEFAHFMDHQLGDMDGKYTYASDDRKGQAYQIASTFRRNMTSAQKSDYQNRTCECFARALEQYFSVKTGDHAEYQATWNETGNHPKHEDFMQHVHPLVESFLKDLSTKHEWVRKSMDNFYSLFGMGA